MKRLLMIAIFILPMMSMAQQVDPSEYQSDIPFGKQVTNIIILGIIIFFGNMIYRSFKKED